MEPASARILPGPRVLGEGMVTEMVPDDAGRLLVLLGWAWQLVPVTP